MSYKIAIRCNHNAKWLVGLTADLTIKDLCDQLHRVLPHCDPTSCLLEFLGGLVVIRFENQVPRCFVVAFLE
jgi:hypothetical protein